MPPTRQLLDEIQDTVRVSQEMIHKKPHGISSLKAGADSTLVHHSQWN